LQETNLVSNTIISMLLLVTLFLGVFMHYTQTT